MSTDTKTRDVATISKIENALDQLLTVVLHERDRSAQSDHRITATPFKWIDPSKLPTREQSETEYLINYPVEWAALIAIHRLGAKLYELTDDTTTMIEVSERVCDRQPNSWQRRMSILNSRWNGIGYWLS